MIRLTDSTRAFLAGSSILVLGTVAGVGLDRAVLIPANALASGALHGGSREHDEVLADLSSTLALTSEQSARVRGIFAEHQSEMDRIWEQIHGDLSGTIDAATIDIEAILDDDQVSRLHTWLAEHHGPLRGHGVGRAH